jgi:rpsU-divergently transcribed protein
MFGEKGQADVGMCCFVESIFSGDSSADLFWYAKRGAISGVYGSTVLHMLTDTDPAKTDTWTFMNNRLDNYASVIQSASEFTKLMKH